LEREASEATARLLRQSPEGFFLPYDLMAYGDQEIAAAGRGSGSWNGIQTRQLQAQVGSSGGYTVQTSVLGDSMIELLRNRTLVLELGAMNLSGLQGDVSIPKLTGGSTSYWLDETTAVTTSTQTFGQLNLTPHKLSADTAFTKQLLAQSSISTESFVRADLTAQIAVALDAAAINGSGSAGEPLGLLNTADIGAQTFSTAAAPTYTEVIGLETDVATANAALNTSSLAYITTSAAAANMKIEPRAGTFPSFVLENGMMNGYRVEVTEQVPTNRTIFGDWSQLIVASWGALDIVVDPYSAKRSHQIQITVTGQYDIGLRHPESFSASDQ